MARRERYHGSVRLAKWSGSSRGSRMSLSASWDLYVPAPLTDAHAGRALAKLYDRAGMRDSCTAAMVAWLILGMGCATQPLWEAEWSPTE